MSAIAQARAVAEHVKRAHGPTLTVLLPFGGNPSRVGWHGMYESLAAIEAMTGKLMTDQKYWEIVNAGADSGLPGSLHDEIWRVV